MNDREPTRTADRPAGSLTPASLPAVPATGMDARDYRLGDVRGKELRDLTVGVIGTGRIGAAVMDRLRGFGCRVLAYDRHQQLAADYVPLDEILPLQRLQELPNVLISPHTAYYTDHALSDIVENSIINCLEFERRNRHE